MKDAAHNDRSTENVQTLQLRSEKSQRFHLID